MLRVPDCLATTLPSSKLAGIFIKITNFNAEAVWTCHEILALQEPRNTVMLSLNSAAQAGDTQFNSPSKGNRDMPHRNRRDVLAGLASTSIVSSVPDFATAGKIQALPNILFILADDMGYGDVGAYGEKTFRTPNIDRLASQGSMLTQAYSNSPVCSATRVALITGRYQYRLKAGLEEPISPNENNLGLPSNHPTLPSLLKKKGYKTALIGKWHLGYLPKFSPLKSGYDEFFGNYGGAIDYFSHKGFSSAADGIFEGETPVETNGYYTDIIKSHATAFLSKNAKNTPFFLSLHFTAPHWPWEGPNDLETSQKLKSLFHYDGGSIEKYGEMIESLDSSIGEILTGLDTLGISDNTIVVFTSDNGGERFSNNWPFSGQKTELLEGGIRVPAVIRWPRKIQKNRNNNQVCISMDWLPTLLAAAEADVDENFPSDGINLLPILTGSSPIVQRKLYWRYKANDQRAIRFENMKYLKIADNEFLFDVVNDKRERANLKDMHPKIFASLRDDWMQWNSTMLPITDEVHTHWIRSQNQADRYSPMK